MVANAAVHVSKVPVQQHERQQMLLTLFAFPAASAVAQPDEGVRCNWLRLCTLLSLNPHKRHKRSPCHRRRQGGSAHLGAPRGDARPLAPPLNGGQGCIRTMCRKLTHVRPSVLGAMGGPARQPRESSLTIKGFNNV